MKIKIEIDSSVEEDEVIVRCKTMSDAVQKIQQTVESLSKQVDLTFWKDGTEFFLPLEAILFFETSGSRIDAHTADDVFQVKQKLYELEEILPSHFLRISKSTIMNVQHIYSIEKNLTASSLVKFRKSHKQVFVSRNYYKVLKQRLAERRNYEI